MNVWGNSWSLADIIRSVLIGGLAPYALVALGVALEAVFFRHLWDFFFVQSIRRHKRPIIPLK